MTTIYKTNDFAFIKHKDYIDNLYLCLQDEEQQKFSLVLNENLFNIRKIQGKVDRKRSVQWEKLQEETLKIKDMFNKYKMEIPKEKEINLEQMQTSEIRELSRILFESTVFDHNGINGGNTSDSPLICTIKHEEFLIPPKSRFYCGCVKEQLAKITDKKFQILIADPPWWNKYIRRLKNANEKLGYTMMYNEDIASIPVQNLLSKTCLIAVWCTNSPSNIDAVKNIIFPQWGVTYITTWYWLKVTTDMEPLCEFSTGNKKQPYERLMLGKIGDVNVPECMLIVSVPSALHSHKPPLLDILKPYIKKEDPQILELFARYLLPNTTSIGYEPLKWQHLSLYEKKFNK